MSRRTALPGADELFRATAAATATAGEPITSYASASSGAKSYRELAKEVLAR